MWQLIECSTTVADKSDALLQVRSINRRKDTVAVAVAVGTEYIR